MTIQAGQSAWPDLASRFLSNKEAALFPYYIWLLYNVIKYYVKYI